MFFESDLNCEMLSGMRWVILEFVIYEAFLVAKSIRNS